MPEDKGSKGYVVADIDDVGHITLRPATVRGGRSKTYTSSFMHAWDWFIENQIPLAKTVKGKVDYDWLVDTIETKYNNKNIRAFVYGKFLEEYGEDMVI